MRANAPSDPTVTSEYEMMSPSSTLRAGPSSGCSQSATRVPSFPLTRSDLPSGIQRPLTLRSSAWVTRVPSPPDADAA